MEKYYLCIKTQNGNIERSAHNFDASSDRDGFATLTELLSFVRRNNEGSIIQPHICYVIEKVSSEYMI